MEVLPTEELRFLGASLDKLDATLVQRILKQDYSFSMSSSGKKIRYYVGETLGEGGFGIVSDCAYMAEGGARLEIAAIKRPKNVEAERFEQRAILDMVDKKNMKPNAAELVRISESIAELRKKVAEGREKVMKRDLPGNEQLKLEEEQLQLVEELRVLEEVYSTGKLNKKYADILGERLAIINFQLNSIDRIFANERMAMQAVMEFGDTTGLLKPRIVSMRGMPDVIIYKKVEPLAGKKITLDDRFHSDRPEEVLQYYYESLQGLDTVHENGWMHLDYKANNVFVGKAGKGEQAFLGDLALVSVEEISHLFLKEVVSKGEKSQSYALLRKGVSDDLSDSRQIGITPSHFSAEHIRALIEYAKRAAKEAVAKGLAPGKIPKHILALADNNQVGVALERYMKALQGTGESGKIIPGKKAKMAHDWGIPESAIDEVIAELAHYSAELKKADGNVTIPEVMVALKAARAKLMRAGKTGANKGAASALPKPISIQ